jgi:heme/copper-type cytochrome/quinol oxidase subunit 2
MSQQGTDTQILLLFVGIGTGALLLLVFGMFLWMVMRHYRRSRELEHLERMKAIELGKPLDSPEQEEVHQKYGYNAFWIAFWIGAAVPVSAAWAASYAVTQGNVKDLGVTLAMWISVAVLGVAGVICATVLMMSARQAASLNQQTSQQPSAGGDLSRP